MHIDLNSCFATVEQQANPKFRGKPLAVAAYKTPNGCILAPSIEAKRLGIKVGMRVKEGKLIYPNLIVLEPDPWKYRNVHLALKNLLTTYTEKITPKSIDEFIVDLEGYPSFRLGITNVAQEIKSRIKREIGDWLTVSIGIGPNRFLAKTASGLKKPDGLETIDVSNFESIFSRLDLADLCGIKTNNIVRLNKYGIFSVTDFYNADAKTLKNAFQSVMGHYWYLRLHGWEIDDVEYGRHSYGNSVALRENKVTPEELAPILARLVEKMSQRMRSAGYRARGVHVSFLYRDGTHWHQGRTSSTLFFDPSTIYKAAYKIICHSPYRLPVHTIAVSCFDLVKNIHQQLYLLEEDNKKERLVTAMDKIIEKWGKCVITPAKMLTAKDLVKDRISFGGVKELEEFIFA